MLEIQNLTAGYGGGPVLKDLSLTLPGGKVTVILGPNGCGKSTLLKVLAGLLPAAGRVGLEGEDLLALPQRERARRVAYLPQQRPVPEITVKRLVLHGRFPYLSYPRQYRREDLAAAQGAMEALGIGDLADRPVGSLSGGQRQKAYIAMALAQDTKAVLLDEPTAWLDIRHQFQLMELAKDLARQGKTVVLVLHDLALALERGDHLVLLKEGRLLAQGKDPEICGTLEAALGVRAVPVETPAGRKYYFEPVK